MLTFSTPSEFNSLFALASGVSAKEQGDRAIGQFGTGLKYAIAITLRLGGSIRIQSSSENLSFFTKSDSFRGKDFDFIWVKDEATGETRPLNFTTDYGKHWEPWMAYRELASNTLDEGGKVYIGPAPEASTTFILVDCPEIELAAKEHNEIFCQGQPIFTTDHLSILPWNNIPALYLKGVAVYKNRGKIFPFTYNFSSLPLTEDRTLDYNGASTAQMYLTQAIAELAKLAEKGGGEEESLALKLLTLPNGFWGTSFEWWHMTGSQKEALGWLLSKHSTNPKLPQPFFEQGKTNGYVKLESWEPSAHQKKLLKEALAFFSTSPFPITFPIEFMKLSNSTYGQAKDGKIILSPKAFDQGLRMLQKTLLEEQTHLEKDVSDGYAIQHEYLDIIINLLEEKSSG